MSARELQPSASIRAYFGWRLRHWRSARGLSQAGLGHAVGYDATYISKLESSQRWPSPGLAARIDQFLNTGGELDTLWPLVERERQLACPTGRAEDAAVQERSAEEMPTRWPGMCAMDALEQLLAAYDGMAGVMGGRDLAAPAEHYARMLVRWQATAPPPAVNRLLGLAAQYAQLAGWARLDNVEYGAALYWFTCGYQWAKLGGDDELASQLLARQSDVYWSTGDVDAAIGLGSAARDFPRLTAGVRAWACIAEARGHAKAGDEYNSRRCLDDASAALHSGEPITGPVGLDSARWVRIHALAQCTCYRDLLARRRRPQLAARMADTMKPLSDVPAHASHYRALVGARLAGAYVASGEPEPATAALVQMINPVTPHRSPRVQRELRTVLEALEQRWPALDHMREVTDLFITAGLIRPGPTLAVSAVDRH